MQTQVPYKYHVLVPHYDLLKFVCKIYRFWFSNRTLFFPMLWYVGSPQIGKLHSHNHKQ